MNGNVGSSLAGRSNRNWGPLPDDGWARGRRQRCTLCTNFTRAHSLLTLAASPVRRFPSPSPPACRPAGKNPRTRDTLGCALVSKCGRPNGNFWTASGELPGGAIELDSARGRPQTCTVCNNSDSRSLLAHPHFFRAAVSSNRRRLPGCMHTVHSSLEVTSPAVWS